jgi:glycosyltransferase involved in cell wall biosynthesis
MSSLRIAVIIPVYNHARYVGQAIESALTQSLPPDCILCIDDGSKDESLAVCQRYADRGVKARGRENQGAHHTINELVRWAHDEGCDWVNILNSDDCYLPGRLAACAAFATENPTKQVISTRLEVIDDDGNVMAQDAKRARWFYGAQSLLDSDNSSVAEALGKANFIATTSNVFARTDYLLANPFRPYRYNHDYYFLAGAAWRDTVGLIADVHMQYRVHGSNTITTKPEPLMREMLRMHLDLYHDYADEIAHSPTMRQRFADYNRALWDNISSFHAGMFQLALAQLVSAFPEEKLKTVAQALEGDEFEISPNRSFAAAFDGTGPLSINALNAKLDELRAEKKAWIEERDSWLELLRVKAVLQGSRWVALGAVLGCGRTLRRNEGKGVTAKLERLREACQSSKWLRLGAAAGSGAAKALLAGA